MAVLKGKGSMTGRNLIVRAHDNAVTKNGKTQYLDIQLDARDEHGPGQTSLHLRSQRQEMPDGSIRWNNGAPYSVSQVEQIKQAAGENTQPVLNKDGVQIGTDYAVKGNLMSSSNGPGLVLNTKSVGAGDFPLEADSMDNQFASMKAAKEAKQAVEAQAQSPQAEAQAEAAQVEQPAVEVEADEPSMG